MVLCHDATRMIVKGFEQEGLPVRDLADCIRIYEEAASWGRPPGFPRTRVAAIALTLRRRKGIKHQDPGWQVGVRRNDRVRLVSMPAEKPATSGE